MAAVCTQNFSFILRNLSLKIYIPPLCLIMNVEERTAMFMQQSPHIPAAADGASKERRHRLKNLVKKLFGA